MFFVYKESTKLEVIGGTVSPKSAKKLAEKRAQSKLKWKPTETGFEAEVDQGKMKITYRIEEK